MLKESRVFTARLENLSVLTFFSHMFSLVHNPNFRVRFIECPFNVSSFCIVIENSDQLNIFTENPDKRLSMNFGLAKPAMLPFIFSEIMESDSNPTGFKGGRIAGCALGRIPR
jgi:hypothetical protein